MWITPQESFERPTTRKLFQCVLAYYVKQIQFFIVNLWFTFYGLKYSQIYSLTACCPPVYPEIVDPVFDQYRGPHLEWLLTQGMKLSFIQVYNEISLFYFSHMLLTYLMTRTSYKT